MASNLHISINAEPLFELFGVPITNSIAVSWVVSIILILFALSVNSKLKEKGKISKLQLMAEFIIESLYGLIEGIVGSKKAMRHFSLIATFFLFIIVSNWTGLLPGAGTIGFTGIIHGEETFIPILRGPTADVNTALALALISMTMVQFYGFKSLGLKYLKKFFNFSNPINAFVGILEFVSEISKIISFTFRLFGNIFAGEVLLSVMLFLLPWFGPVPFIGLEIFVGFIQALVFAMLSIVFINMATISHEGDH